MLILRQNQGATLIELMIGLAILAMLLAAGAPNFATWIKNTKIRNAAESIQNGLQLARSEAVHSNRAVQFSLTTNVGSSCALSTSDSNWVVSWADPTGLCDKNPLSKGGPANPGIIQLRPAADGSSNVVVAADQSAVVFNGLGQVTSAATSICLGITGVASSGCFVTGDERHLQVVVSVGGQVRMCDPKFTAGSDPQGC